MDLESFFVVFGLELVAGSVISELAVQICDLLVVISGAASLLPFFSFSLLDA
jgi:hypothetical protein